MLINLLIFLGMLAFFWLVTFLTSSERRRNLKRIEKMHRRKLPAAKPGQNMSLRRKKEESKGLIYYLSKPMPNFKRLGDFLERAGKTTTPKQYAFRRLLSVLAITFACVLFGKSPLIGFFLGIIVGVWLPLKLLKFKINKRKKAFLRVFPDGIDLIVRGLRSGLPVSESLLLVSQEVPEPVSGVFGTIVNTMKLGVTMEKALFETAKKLDMTEFNFFTTSIVLQRETGGNLSEILNNLSEVLRGRFMMQMKIKAMSSEARASGYIIGALPFMVLGAVTFISPDYVKPLWNDYRGNICAAVAAGMMVTGLWTMSRMAKFEI